ncbi:DUF1275 family protein [Rhodopseudomonas sp. P2A-2r]|uniref:YoaK family protein n=1 Tax=Rhodopseudomonas sp. P2A-2r TaxID=2991972 RepID=UPI002234D1F1|nr:YoaK family protein [Rhodopseudomonas sp. P2A-2r]UZE49846.1 DUF1275 family protein [Rhodopseudomonas sp. P2A-2r]
MTTSLNTSVVQPSVAMILLFSTIAGSTDTISFLSLGGLFAAHVTGNVVLMAGHLAAGGKVGIAQLIAVPVFMMVVALMRFFEGRLGRVSLDTLIALQLTFLALFLLMRVLNGQIAELDSLSVVFAGMCGVAAMATQSVLVQSMPGMPSTTMVTVDITRFSMGIVDLMSRQANDHATSLRNVQAVGPAIAGFVCGCCLGAALHRQLGTQALTLPVLLSAIALWWHGRRVAAVASKAEA